MAAVAHVTGGRALATVQFASACGSLADRSTLRLLSAGHRGRSSSCSRRRVPASQRVTSKMVIPGFGESPEAKSAASLHNFFTYIAVRIVLSQLQAYNREGYAELKEFTDRVPLKDGDQFCAALMRESPRHKQLGSPSLCTGGFRMGQPPSRVIPANGGGQHATDAGLPHGDQPL
ncbi:hypothetical protein CLOM_g16938 [Closterium sp. NIES-68]|nr:hypothetical protein CLOM_g16938 [Closterium sp. NIES-68]GJP85348.1 hypothetical protein CLOP_g15449 [Closterium sp. NIES-67]